MVLIMPVGILFGQLKRVRDDAVAQVQSSVARGADRADHVEVQLARDGDELSAHGADDETTAMQYCMPMAPMQNFNVPFKQTSSPKQYCKAPCRLLMGRLPWARASRTRLRPCG